MELFFNAILWVEPLPETKQYLALIPGWIIFCIILKWILTWLLVNIRLCLINSIAVFVLNSHRKWKGIFLPDLYFIDKKSNGNFFKTKYVTGIINETCKIRRYLQQNEYQSKSSNWIHLGDSFRRCFISWALNTLHITLLILHLALWFLLTL
jgi:hypothetical protein